MPDQRYRLIQEYEAGESISAWAEIYGLSRKTVCKWIERQEQEGLAGAGADQAETSAHAAL